MAVLWGDRDHLAPPPVVEAYRALATRMPNLTLDIFPGVGHGYMMRGSPAFDQAAYDASMARTLAIVDGLR